MFCGFILRESTHCQSFKQFPSLFLSFQHTLTCIGTFRSCLRPQQSLLALQKRYYALFCCIECPTIDSPRNRANSAEDRAPTESSPVDVHLGTAETLTLPPNSSWICFCRHKSTVSSNRGAVGTRSSPNRNASCWCWSNDHLEDTSTKMELKFKKVQSCFESLITSDRLTLKNPVI